jgi:hypothetical protein
MSIVTITLWLAVAMYPALKFERAIDKALTLLWVRVIVPSCKALMPKPEGRVRLAIDWLYWQLTRTK